MKFGIFTIVPWHESKGQQQSLDEGLEQIELADKLGIDEVWLNVVDSKAASSRIPWLLATTFSLANVPTLSVPCGFTESGLPIGLQIAGRPFDESTVLNAGHVYEQNNDWHNRKPEV